jgi:hypothetical protein
VEGEHLAVEILPNGDLVAALGVRDGEGVCDLDLFRFCLLTGGGGDNDNDGKQNKMEDETESWYLTTNSTFEIRLLRHWRESQRTRLGAYDVSRISLEF